MPTTYPPGSPTARPGGYLNDAHAFLNSTQALQRRVAQVAPEMFITPQVFTGRIQAPGHVVYTVDESPYALRDPEVVSPGAEYGRLVGTHGEVAVATIPKRGYEMPITDEVVGRLISGTQEVENQLTKLLNSLRNAVDTIGMQTLDAATVTRTPAYEPWHDPDTARPEVDASRAIAAIRNQKLGLQPTHLVVSELNYGNLLASRSLAGSFSGVNVTIANQGATVTIRQLIVTPTPNLPNGETAYIVCAAMLGSLAFERIPSPDWAGDPSTSPEVRSRRDPAGNDQQLIAARWPITPVVDHLTAVHGITGLVEMTPP